MVLHARYADLAVLGQADPDNPPLGAGVVEAVLLGSGRPALVVPFIGAESVGQRVLVAWNATREAARALNDAMPLLAQAEKVTVLSVNPERGIGGEGDLPAADIALHLARHGVKAEAAHTTAEDVSVGDILLSRAADLGADLIVMGGYGHSRAREFVLGAPPGSCCGNDGAGAAVALGQVSSTSSFRRESASWCKHLASTRGNVCTN